MISQILQGSAIPTFVIDTSHSLTHWNKACERLTGFSAREMIGTKKQWMACFSEKKPVMADLIVDKASKKVLVSHFGNGVQESPLMDGAYEAEGFFSDLGKEGKWLFVTAAPLKDEQGNIFGSVETLQDVTDRKRTEKELKQSADKFRIISDFTYDWEYWIDPEGNYVYVSPSCKNITGYEPIEFLENVDFLASISHPDDREKILQHFENEITSNKVYHLDFRIITREGEERWIAHSCQAVIDANGNYLGRRASNRNISQRKQLEDTLQKEREEIERRVQERTKELSSAYSSLRKEEHARKIAYGILEEREEELRKRNEFIEIILDNLPIGLAVNTVDDEVVQYMNSKFAEIYGQPRDVLVSFDAFFEHVYPDPAYRKWIKKRVVDDIASRDLSKMIWENVLPITQNGEQRVVTAINIPLFEQNLMISTVQDVTKKYKADQALQFTRFSIDHANDLLYWVNSEGNIIDVNETTCNRLGYEKDELLSMTMVDVDPGLTLDKYLEDWVILKQDGTMTVETTHRSKEGEAIPVEVHRNYIEFDGKEYNCAFARDITMRRELERLVAVQDKMGSLGRVAAGIAHEIRNPLSTINVYLSTLKSFFANTSFDTNNMASIKEAITEMDTASHKVESVIKRVMDFSKPAQHTIQLIDVNHCVRNSVDLAKVTLRKSGVMLELKLDEKLPECYLDNQLIEQLLLNLITNAIEELIESQEEKQIEIRTTESGRNGERFIALSVADSGSGVPPENRDKIFDPFFTTKDYGSGIGLSICHRIISDHHGLLHVATSKWGGAKFVAEFPVRQQSKK